MGNQIHSPRSSMRRTTTTNTERTHGSSDQRQIIDLDDIVEQWVLYIWNRTKTKSFSHYKQEELLVIINWKRVLFTQSEVHFSGSSPVRLPKSQILFRTNFNNKTSNEHSYLFKTERFTSSTFRFTFTHCLKKSQDSVVMFRLPEEIIELGGGIRREQSIEFGQDTIKEYTMCWSVNSQILVAPYTRTYAELNIDEEELNGDFSVSIQFHGRITAAIATRQSPNTYLQFIEADIVQIIREIMENNHRLYGLEIVEENPSVVQYTMRGTCAFRYGVEQHILLNQESLDQPSSSFLAPSNSRPLQARIPSLNNDIHLKITDDEQ